MKHIIHSSCAALFLALAISVFVTGCDNNELAPVLPADAGAIDGPSGLVKGETVVLSIDAIRYATAYRWYKDGKPVQESGDRMLDVTLPGNYTVAGVNAFGEGVPSPVKEVTDYMRPQMFIDRLAGDWNVEEIVVIDNNPYVNNHIVHIECIDDTKVSISNFCYANTRPETDFGDTVVGMVDSDAKTLKIPSAELIPTWSSGVATFIAPAMNNDFTKNIGVDFPEQSFTEENGVLRLVMHTGPHTVNIDGRMYPVIYYVSGVSGNAYAGTFGYFVGTTWTKM